VNKIKVKRRSKIKDYFLSMGLKKKFIFTTTGVILLLGLMITVFVHVNQIDTLTHVLQKEGVSITKNLSVNAQVPILTEDIVGLKRLVDDVVKVQEDVFYVFILNPKKFVLVHTFEKGVPAALAEINSPAPGKVYSSQLLTTEKGYIRDIAVPINTLGIVHVGMSENRIRQTVAQTTRTLLIMTLSMMVLGMLLTSYIVAWVLKPLNLLTQGAEEIGNDNLEYRIQIKTKDEIGMLADKFNQMAERLKLSRLKLQQWNEELEQRVEERTQELKEAQEQLVRKEKLAVLGQLASSISHEIRNPIGVIGNAVYYLNMKLKNEDEKVVRYLDILNREVKKTNTIVTDLLDFSKTSLPAFEKIDLNRIIKNVLVGINIPENITLVTQLDENLPEIFKDPCQMQQAIQNIINNALQAMPKGGSLEIKTGTKNNFVEITLMDSGKGIKENDLKKIFEPLFTTKAKGIGLGLAIVKDIIDKNNGVIEVKSELDKGTAFTIKLPVNIEMEKK
jgi:signal transduction histidine kinase